MSVRIRLARFGRKGRPFYRVVVANSSAKRDGKYLELIGTVDPMSDPAAINIKEDRVKHWVEQGAKPTDSVSHYIDKVIPSYLSDIEEKRREKIRSRRKARKERVAARAKA